jgi:hypothetical protein
MISFFKKNLNESEDYIFDIDINKGLYVGSGIKLVGTEEEKTIVKPVFIQWSDLAGHLAVYGTTRVGKTRLMVSIIRQCILRNMDILVVEPKGAVGNKKDEKGLDLGIGQETMAWVSEFAEEAGRLRDIKYVSPMFPDISLKFNPLFGLGNEEIASLVATIIPAKEEFFTAMGYQITMCILLGLEFLEKAEGKEDVNRLIEKEYARIYSGNSNIVDEISGISNPDLADRVVNKEIISELTEQTPPYRSLMTFAEIATYATQEGVNAILEHVKRVTPDQFNTSSYHEEQELLTLRSEAMRALTEMAEKDKQYFSKVSSSFNLIMSQLSTGALGKILCTTKINPIMDGFMNEKNGQILIIQPFPLIYKKASDAFVRVFFSVLSSFYGNIGASGRSSPREIALFVDEGGAVLYPGVEHLFNKAGGLGLRIFIFTQSFADYEAELGPEVSKIVNDNTNIKVYMRMNDSASREEVSKAFSKIRIVENKYMGSKLDMRISAAAEERDILLPAHMGDMQKQEFLLQFGDGRFYCCAPFQPDPGFLFRMPEINMESTFKTIGRKYMSESIGETEQIKETIEL